MQMKVITCLCFLVSVSIWSLPPTQSCFSGCCFVVLSLNKTQYICPSQPWDLWEKAPLQLPPSQQVPGANTALVHEGPLQKSLPHRCPWFILTQCSSETVFLDTIRHVSVTFGNSFELFYVCFSATRQGGKVCAFLLQHFFL